MTTDACRQALFVLMPIPSQNSLGLHSQLYKHCFMHSFPAASKTVGMTALSFMVLLLTSGDCSASERISVLTFSFQ